MPVLQSCVQTCSILYSYCISVVFVWCTCFHCTSVSISQQKFFFFLCGRNTIYTYTYQTDNMRTCTTVHYTYMYMYGYVSTVADVRLTLSLETPISPFSLVSMLVQERNSIPNSSKLDHSFTNQHLASRTAMEDTAYIHSVHKDWCLSLLYHEDLPDSPFSAACSASICLARFCIESR